MPTSPAPELPLPERGPGDPPEPPARWWSDTLAKRLFAWLWVALVVSHVVAIVLTHAVFGSPHRLRLASMPVLPALPPTPGLHDTPQRLGAQLAAQWQAPAGPATAAMAAAAAPAGPPPLPTRHLLLDYLLRTLLLAAFAWAGARWLARPMGQLSQAARRLAAAPGSATPPRLAETGMAEVRRTAHAFNRMAQQLNRHVRERELTMAAISHDLRTPLTRMRLRLERLRAQPGAEACIADVREMDALIGQVLALLRDAQAAEPATLLDLPALLQALLDDRAELGASVSLQHGPPGAPPDAPKHPTPELRDSASTSGHSGTTDTTDTTDITGTFGTLGTPGAVLAPPLSLRRLLDNLLDNAIRHGSRADVRLWRSGPAHWTVRIDDRGPGLSATQLHRALQPWQQLGAGAPADARGGSGLGLYIADQLARGLGATLQWRNRAGGGLSVSLCLPLGVAGAAPVASQRH
ncbi:ATP-binding protein [Aquabacterium sp. OR-4]|uniref:ATP-binding protein n=1 Tax=Aquabacterium sp. OR-4 TaxID=2978127 RepID=UPI0021B2A531|nr:ATP-binding protein [Aquabacterium sp. OR-4]MDT7834230.1 ATP-binding protein [Aquabacterium sp. OR-4]